MRAWLAKSIPPLHYPLTVTDTDVQAVQNNGVIHRWLVGADAAWGAIGSKVPATTISGRTGRTLCDAQSARIAVDTNWYDSAPIWALALGWALEGVDSGHLQGAMNADLARQVAGILYLTGRRVLRPGSVT
jgi:hypothetical protein